MIFFILTDEEGSHMEECLGDRVRKQRLYWGMSPTELARRADIQRQQVYMIESNKTRDPGVLTVNALAKALRVTVDYLVNGGECEKQGTPPAEESVLALGLGRRVLSMGTEKGSIHDLCTSV
jgi:transcriptional regulator with XRE-family HTH domain